MIDSTVAQELLRQYGLTYTLLAFMVAVLATAILNVIVYYAYQRIEKGRQQELEQLRSQLSTTERRLQDYLDTRSHVLKAQFEKEFSVYSDIWDDLIDLRSTALKLRPIFDSVDINEPQEERKKKRLLDFANAYNKCMQTIEKNKPFYAPNVYAELEETRGVLRIEAIEYQYNDQIDDKYWESAQSNAGKIVENIDTVCEAIRDRLTNIVVIED